MARVDEAAALELQEAPRRLGHGKARIEAEHGQRRNF